MEIHRERCVQCFTNMLIFPFDNVWDFYSHSYPISHLTSNVAIWTGRLIRLISNAQSHYPSSNAGFEDNVTFSVKCDMEGISEEDVHLRFAINIVKWCNKISVDRFFSAITLILRFLLHAFKDRFFFLRIFAGRCNKFYLRRNSHRIEINIFDQNIDESSIHLIRRWR